MIDPGSLFAPPPMVEKRRPSKKRPTARSLELLRKNGCTAQVVERWQMIPRHPGGGVRQDLFGCIDVVSISEDFMGRPGGSGCMRGIAGIQCGADSGHSTHKKKCLAEPRLQQWLQAGGLFFIHSWGKKGAAGKAKRWEVRIEELTLADFEKPADLFA